MNKFIVVLLLPFLMMACEPQKAPEKSEEEIKTERLSALKAAMVGNFNSADQAERDTNYFDITLNMSPVWDGEGGKHWLYVEQAVSKMLDRPYRQRVYLLEALSSDTFRSNVYTLPGPKRFIGSQPGDSIWQTITPDSLELLPGCGLYLAYENGAFSGATNKEDCLNNWGEAAYATSEVRILGDTLLSWDRGWDSTNTQVWGAENGGYYFIKQQKEIQ
ncbi:MAG: chromophore lyase CpcT/CpeT [Bacteroidia bacterium]